MQKAAAEEVSKCASLLTYLSEVIVIDRTLLLNSTDLCPSINPNRVPVGNTLRYRRFPRAMERQSCSEPACRHPVRKETRWFFLTFVNEPIPFKLL